MPVDRFEHPDPRASAAPPAAVAKGEDDETVPPRPEEEIADVARAEPDVPDDPPPGR